MSTIEGQKRIYLDYASTTPVDPRVLEAMAPFWNEHFGNPGGLHKEGVFAKQIVLECRKKIASYIGASPAEIIFTSSGTESNNMAIFGFVKRLEGRGVPLKETHWVTSTIEHPSALDCFKYLEARGAEVSYAPVTPDGVLDISLFKKFLKPNTVFVSIMLVNNEIGTVEPIKEIGKILKNHKVTIGGISRPIFHTDASQGPVYFPIHVGSLNVDMLTLDAQKMYGPKGIGCLYIGNGVSINQILIGGKQEKGIRPGTENVPGIVGFAKAFEIVEEERDGEVKRLTSIRDWTITELQKIRGIEMNGSLVERAPNNINFSVPGIDNEWLVIQLDARGFAVGTRSACLAGEVAGSYVIAALGKSEEYSKSSLRVTMGRQTTKDNMESFMQELQKMIAS